MYRLVFVRPILPTSGLIRNARQLILNGRCVLGEFKYRERLVTRRMRIRHVLRHNVITANVTRKSPTRSFVGGRRQLQPRRETGTGNEQISAIETVEFKKHACISNHKDTELGESRWKIEKSFFP